MRATMHDASPFEPSTLISMIEAAPVAIMVLNRGRFEYVNGEAVKLLGFRDAGDMMGREAAPYLGREFVEEIGDWMEGRRSGGEGRQARPTERLWCRVDRAQVPVEVRGMRYGADRIVLFAEDVTEHVNSKLRMLQLNRLLRTIRELNHMIVGERSEESLIRQACELLVSHGDFVMAVIALLDDHGNLLAWASEGSHPWLAGLAEDLRAGRIPPCWQMRVVTTVGDDVECAETRCPWPSEAGEKAHIHCAPLTVRGEHLGYLAVVSVAVSGWGSEWHRLVPEIAADLAYAVRALRVERARARAEREREELNRQLSQLDKLDALGRLAGGVAHDFNNLLMGIMGNVDLCRDLLPSDHPARECLNEIMQAAERSSDLTRQLLAFARRQTVAPRNLDLNRRIEAMLSLLRRLIGEHIQLEWVPGNLPGPVKIDPGQLDQILANLCVNARDAIGDAGRITISTAVVDVDESRARRHGGGRPGPYVRLSVVDTGCGMTPEVLAHIFEPFFTTKKRGIGTGLGLSTVDGIVRQHGGFIEVESAPGRGSAFHIFLPLSTATPEEVEPVESEERLTTAPRGSETILLVEDDPSICLLTERFLASLGYRVLSADGPLQALDIARRYDGPIHLVLTDVIMPDCSGREMINRLAADRPNLKCIYMSGYPANVIAHHGVLEPGIDFLQKPVSLADLARKIREVLDRAVPEPPASPHRGG